MTTTESYEQILQSLGFAGTLPDKLESTYLKKIAEVIRGIGTPTDEQTQAAIDALAEEHPEIFGGMTEAQVDEKINSAKSELVALDDFESVEVKTNNFSVSKGETLITSDAQKSWKCPTTSGKKYSEGTTTSNYATSNLIVRKKQNVIYKMSLREVPPYFRVIGYDNDGYYKTATTGNATIDTDGYLKFEYTISLETAPQICVLCSNSAIDDWDNIILNTEDKFSVNSIDIKGYKVANDTLEDIDLRLNGTDDIPLSKIIKDGGFCQIFRKIAIIGDSLGSGEMAYGDAEDESTSHYVDMYEYSWIQYIARICGSTAYNISKGGLSTRTFLTYNNGEYLNKLLSDDYKSQAYFIALGHNDRNQSIPIGTISDIDTSNCDNNADTYYGNYAKIISKIKTVQPDAKIFCVGMKNSNAFASYNNAIKDIVALFGTNIYYLDMATYSAPLKTSWEYTQGHGNTMGYLNYAWQISSYVDWIIRHNTDDFKYVQFIGTEYPIPTN